MRKDIFNNLKRFYLEMSHNQRSYQKFGFFYKFTTNDFFINSQILLYLISIILNIIMLIYLDADHIDSTDADATPLFTSETFGEVLIDIVSFVILAFSLLLSITWVIAKFKLEYSINLSYSKLLA